MKTILDLKFNQKAIIKNISTSAGKEFINDIMDHGVFPGTLIMISDLSKSNDKVIFFSGLLSFLLIIITDVASDV